MKKIILSLQRLLLCELLDRHQAPNVISGGENEKGHQENWGKCFRCRKVVVGWSVRGRWRLRKA